MGKLTAKQELFVQEYLIDMNASAACIRSGYRSKNPDVDGYRLLVKPSITDAIRERMAIREKRTEITQDMVVSELRKVAFDNDPTTGGPYRDSAKMKALELLGKHLGMFVERIQLNASMTVEDALDAIDTG